MDGFVDLHCHYIPAIDDGVRTHEEGVAAVPSAEALGYDAVAATPHIRSGMFENRKPDLVRRFDEFAANSQAPRNAGAVLGAEHFCDDVWQLFETNKALPYAGGKAALIEFPPEHCRSASTSACFACRCAACGR